MQNADKDYSYSDNLALVREVQAGSEEALERLVEANMGLVRSIVRRFADRGAETEDLLQLGAIGMVKAAKSFDESYGTVFSTYAVPLIVGEIRRHLRDDGIIKVSRELKKSGALLMRRREELSLSLGREPTVGELASACGMSAETAAAALDAVCPVLSLSEKVGEGENVTLENLLPAQGSEIDALTDRLALAQALCKLDERSRAIIIMRYYRDMSQQQTAAALGLTQVKVSREEKRIIRFLREEIG